jgi:hypothetical protein
VPEEIFPATILPERIEFVNACRDRSTGYGPATALSWRGGLTAEKIFGKLLTNPLVVTSMGMQAGFWIRKMQAESTG